MPDSKVEFFHYVMKDPTKGQGSSVWVITGGIFTLEAYYQLNQ